MSVEAELTVSGAVAKAVEVLAVSVETVVDALASLAVLGLE